MFNAYSFMKNIRRRNCIFFSISMIAVCCGQAYGMEKRGLLSIVPLSIMKPPQLYKHIQFPWKLLTSFPLRKCMKPITLPTQWALGFVQRHPKKIIGTAVVAGVFAVGYHYFSKMIGIQSAFYACHKKLIEKDIRAFGQMSEGAQALRDKNRMLHETVNSEFDGLESDTSRILSLLEGFGNSLNGSLDKVDGSARGLARKEDLHLLGREISALSTDVVAVLERQAQKIGGNGKKG